MVQRIKQIISFTGLLTLTVFFTGCDLGSSGSSMGTMEVRLHDAPANYDEVNVHIDSVQVNRGGSDEGWITISTPDQTYDLLELSNGASEVLGEAELETGRYNQIRLILSRDGHNVVVDGEPHSMFVPSGQETGVKLNVNAEIEEGITYTLLLDFDAKRSVVNTGGQGYLLQPVIRATNEAITGNIEGTITPAEAQAAVYAIADSDTLSTVYADTSNGYFQLFGLEEGTYTVSAEPQADGYQSAEKTGVEVTVGETTDAGEIDVQ